MGKENTWCVYMHTNKINNKRYIGISSNIKGRWKGNGTEYKRQVIGKAFDRYGWDNFEHEILFENLSQEDAEKKEVEMIAFYQSNNKLFGYNISQGGENGHNELWNNEDYRESQRQERKSRWQDEEFKIRCRKAINEAISKDECKQKQAKNTENRWKNGDFDNIHCKQIICLETGEVYKSMTEAANITGFCRTNIEKCCSNQQKTAHGYHWQFYNQELDSEEYRLGLIDKIGNGRGVKILCVETGVVYNSITEAAKEINGDTSTIAKALKGKRKFANGYHWEYYEKL